MEYAEIQKELKDLGLTDREANLFLISLKAGLSTANYLSELSENPRSSTYDTLKALMRKGFISSLTRDKKTYYQAIEPEQLIHMEESRIFSVKKIIPDLKKFQVSLAEHSNVEMYVGLKGVNSLFNEMYHGKEILAYGSGVKVSEYLEHIPRQFALKRVEMNIKMRLIMEKSPEAMFRVKDPKIAKFTELRTIDEMKDYPALVLITDDAVGIIMMGQDLSGVIIKNKALIETQKSLFEYLWKNAQYYRPRKK